MQGLSTSEHAKIAVNFDPAIAATRRCPRQRLDSSRAPARGARAQRGCCGCRCRLDVPAHRSDGAASRTAAEAGPTHAEYVMNE